MIRLAIVELVQNLLEQRTVGDIRSRFSEQGKTRSKLEIVGRTKDLQCRLILVARHQAHIMAQSATERRVRQISPSLI